MVLNSAQPSVAVVGAGPAGLFAARELSTHGVNVILFNRDIKPGGLAEYGIFPDKLKMKEGLRAQFKQILSDPNITYFGNVTVGSNHPLTLDQLRNWGFSAILVTTGAQGTKWLGLPGEHLPGVYHAKEVVYNYNRLPPFSLTPLKIGKRAAIIGAGNVMADVSRYLIHHRKVDEVIDVVRRGPAEVKFDRKELESFVTNIDMADFDAEIQRVKPVMLSLGQDPDAPRKLIEEALPKGVPRDSETRFRFRFLYSPVRVLGSEEHGVEGLEVEENTLVLDGGSVKARGLGTTKVLDVDTVIFAIGDRVDESFGLPVNGLAYVKLEHPNYPVEGISFEVMDPATGKAIPGIFVGGWSRNASNGVVGIARRDGIQSAHAVLQYLSDGAKGKQVTPEFVQEQLLAMGYTPVKKEMLTVLESAERIQAQRLGVPEFKFVSNDEMLQAIGESEVA